MEKKEIVLARKNLAISREWKEIKLNLFEIIKDKYNGISINGDYVKGMLKTIDIVDKWVEEFETLRKKEEKE